MNPKKISSKELLKRLETTVRTLEAGLYENAAISDNEAYAELYNRINEGFPKVIKMNYRS
jgi:hypothetical protein